MGTLRKTTDLGPYRRKRRKDKVKTSRRYGVLRFYYGERRSREEGKYLFNYLTSILTEIYPISTPIGRTLLEILRTPLEIYRTLI